MKRWKWWIGAGVILGFLAIVGAWKVFGPAGVDLCVNATEIDKPEQTIFSMQIGDPGMGAPTPREVRLYVPAMGQTRIKMLVY